MSQRNDQSKITVTNDELLEAYRWLADKLHLEGKPRPRPAKRRRKAA